MDQIILGTGEVAKFFDVTMETMRQWHKAGCPKLKRGQWDLKAVFKWYAETILAERDTSETLQAVKQRYWRAKTEREEIRVKVEKGELFSKADVIDSWVKRVAEYKNGLYYFVDSLPPLLEGKNQREMRAVIDGLVWEMLDRVCREGTFCPATKEAKRTKKR